jgi:hypothetical protein
MSELGSVFEGTETSDDVPRGPDLTIGVEVPRSALGRGGGYVAEVPASLVHASERVRRFVDDEDPPGGVRLHLSPTMPDRARLRLRGRGGVHPEGAPGDLFVDVTVVDDASASTRLRVWVALAVLVAVAAILAATR